MAMSFSVWNYKPWWCQPWSIILTGMVIIGGSWQLLQNIPITALLSILVISWWVYFLILYPRLVKKMLNADGNLMEKE
jgi:hypothetical protein